MRPSFVPATRRTILGFAVVLFAGCASAPGALPSSLQVEVAFSPEAKAEALVLKVIDTAKQSIRLAGYSFTSPAVVRALIAAKRRGIDVAVLLDDRGNRGKANLAAMNLVVGAGIPTRVISTYAIHHDKYIVVDGKHTETGSFNYSQAAAKSNSENVLVIWNNEGVAARYTEHWNDRWRQGVSVEVSY